MHINLFLNSLFCRWEIQTHSSRRLSSGCCCLRRNQCRRGSRVCSDLCIWFTPTRTDIPEKPWLQRFLWRKYNFPHFEFCWREMFTLPKWKYGIEREGEGEMGNLKNVEIKSWFWFGKFQLFILRVQLKCSLACWNNEIDWNCGFVTLA